MDNTQLYQERRSPENGCIKPSEPYERFIFADFNKSQYDASKNPSTAQIAVIFRVSSAPWYRNGQYCQTLVKSNFICAAPFYIALVQDELFA